MVATVLSCLDHFSTNKKIHQDQGNLPKKEFNRVCYSRGCTCDCYGSFLSTQDNLFSTCTVNIKLSDISSDNPMKLFQNFTIYLQADS